MEIQGVQERRKMAPLKTDMPAEIDLILIPNYLQMIRLEIILLFRKKKRVMLLYKCLIAYTRFV